MRFFTKAWATGGLRDGEFEAAPGAYWRHLAGLGLPADVAALAAVDLHDARVTEVVLGPEPGRVTLVLRAGDLQRGYAIVRVTYGGASVDPALLERLADRAHDVLYDEVDREGTGYVHRMLLSSM